MRFRERMSSFRSSRVHSSWSHAYSHWRSTVVGLMPTLTGQSPDQSLSSVDSITEFALTSLTVKSPISDSVLDQLIRWILINDSICMFFPPGYFV